MILNSTSLIVTRQRAVCFLFDSVSLRPIRTTLTPAALLIIIFTIGAKDDDDDSSHRTNKKSDNTKTIVFPCMFSIFCSPFQDSAIGKVRSIC